MINLKKILKYTMFSMNRNKQTYLIKNDANRKRK